MNKLNEARSIINEADKEIALQWEKRMKAVEQVVQYKMEHSLPVLDASREKEVIERNVQLIEDENLKPYYVQMLQMMMEISKKYQKEIMER